MVININQWAFKYQDSEYFEWFSMKEKNREIEIFRKMLKWKGLIRKINAEKAWDDWKRDKYFNKYPLVTTVFLKHLKAPEQFPILDKNVWKAFREIVGEINGRKIVKKPTDWERHYLKGYKKFFDELYEEKQNEIKCDIIINGVDAEIIKKRILDRALWEYGRLLNNGQQILHKRS